MNGRGEFFKEELLSGYLDGELSDGQRRYVERMLDQDPEIRGRYQALCALSDRLRGLDRYRLSDEAAQRVSAEVETASLERSYGTTFQASSDELISAYVDGELTDPERVAVEQRMEQDERQRRLFERLCTLQRRLALLPTYRLDEGFAVRVVRQIESLSPSESEQSVELAVAVRRDSGSSDRTRRALALNLRGVIWAVAAIATAILLMVFAPRGDDQNGPPVVTPKVMPPGTENSPLTLLVGSLRRTRLVLVYEVLVTEDGVRDAAFSNLLRRHGIGFAETSAIGREEQKDLLRHRFLENVQVADDRRAEMDRVDL
jgi:anti-sigma factor RsiW